MTGADTVAVMLLDEQTDELVARAARGLDEWLARGVRIPVGEGFSGRIAARPLPSVLEDVQGAPPGTTAFAAERHRRDAGRAARRGGHA